MSFDVELAKKLLSKMQAEGTYTYCGNRMMLIGFISELIAIKADRDSLASSIENLSTTMGVGNGAGNLFVYGDYDSIKAAQKIVIERDSLRIERDVLTSEAAYLRDEIKTHSQSVHYCDVCGKDDPCANDDVCWALNHELPATDAFLNSVRAEGVEMFALYLAETAIKEGADLTGWKSTASNEACDYATQLRKSKDGE